MKSEQEESVGGGVQNCCPAHIAAEAEKLMKAQHQWCAVLVLTQKQNVADSDLHGEV